MRSFRFALAASLFLSLVPAPQRSYVDWYEQMVAAYRQGDDAGMARAAEGALRVRPRFPSMMINLAVARARLGDHDGALGLLEDVAGMGLAYPIEDADELDPLAELPRFRDVVARMHANDLPLGEADVAFTLPEKDFFPEGLAFDARSGTFFLGSVRTGAIVRVGRSGDAEPFAQLSWSVLGMKIDPRRDLLWASISGLEQRVGLAPDRRGRAGIAAIDLRDGSVQREYILPETGVERAVGDLVIDDDGGVYASDSIAGGVWLLRPEADVLVPVLPDGALASPQGLAIALDGALYVAAYNGGIFRLDPGDGTAERLQVPDEVSLYGVDGLCFDGDDLLAVQNGIAPQRVVRLRLNGAGNAVSGAEVLLRAHDRFGEPTLGAVAGDDFYLVANSPWAHFADASQPPDPESLPVPTILRLPLRRR